MKLYKLVSKVFPTPRKFAISKNESLIECTVSQDGSDDTQTCKFDLSTIAARSDAADHTAYVLTDKGNIYSLYAQTLPSRQSGREFFLGRKESVIFAVLMPSKNNLDTVSVVTVLGVNDEIVLSGDLTDSGEISSYMSLMPIFEIGQAQRTGDIVQFAITCPTEKSVTAYVQSSAGNVLTSQVQLKDGAGSALVSVAGLPQGLVGEVKIGFKFYTSVCKQEFLV